MRIEFLRHISGLETLFVQSAQRGESPQGWMGAAGIALLSS